MIQNNNPDTPAVLKGQIAASPEKPANNLCLVIKDFGVSDAQALIDGKRQDKSSGVRLGSIRKMDGTDLIVWVERKTTKPVDIKIKPGKRN